jgi:hypothetical protein
LQYLSLSLRCQSRDERERTSSIDECLSLRSIYSCLPLPLACRRISPLEKLANRPRRFVRLLEANEVSRSFNSRLRCVWNDLGVDVANDLFRKHRAIFISPDKVDEEGRREGGEPATGSTSRDCLGVAEGELCDDIRQFRSAEKEKRERKNALLHSSSTFSASLHHLPAPSTHARHTPPAPFDPTPERTVSSETPPTPPPYSPTGLS